MTRLILLFLIAFGSTASAQQQLTSSDLKALVERMSGIYDNQEQARNNQQYAPIELNIREISLKGRKLSGHWLYVEQALNANGNKVYHQRVYNIYREKDGVRAKLYELKDPQAFVGAWSKPEQFKSLVVDSLVEGCILYFTKDDQGNFTGNTLNRDCLNSQNGAVYATTELIVTPNQIIHWDRGYNDQGQQVWGAETGGYRFRKFTRPKFD